MDYSKGKIYKIIDESNGDLYIGSTIQELHTRFSTHHIFKQYNKIMGNCKISLIEEYPCNSKRELFEREQYWMDKIDCINKTRAFTSKKKEKEISRKRSSKHYYENKEEYINRSSKYYYENKEVIKKRAEWQKSMGGRIDLNNNSLVKIDPDLFL